MANEVREGLRFICGEYVTSYCSMGDSEEIKS